MSTGQESIIDNQSSKRIGINIGYSEQDQFPFASNDYSHITRFVKIQLGQEVWRDQQQSLEVLIEPSLYFVNHELLNLFFIKPSQPNFEEQRARFTQNRSYEEYALNLGITYNYDLKDDLLVYGLLSIGPMIATADTERQKKGFSFSDVLGLGTRYKINSIELDVRLSLRHVSNANLRSPNNGHNSAGIEIGFSYHL